MRITILANRDLAANVVVDRLVRALAPRHELSLVLSPRVGRPGPVPAPLRELKRHEQDLPMGLVSRLASGAARPPQALGTFAEIGARLDGRVADVARPRTETGRAALLARRPELMLSIRYGGILDGAHARAVPHGILNLHSGRLPHYRGVLASARALLAGENVLTATLHRIVDTGIDTGPVIDACEIPWDADRTLLWNVVALYGPGTGLLVEAVRRIEAGAALPGTPQDPEAGAYHGAPDEAALAQLTARGVRLVDLGETLELLTALYVDGDAAVLRAA